MTPSKVGVGREPGLLGSIQPSTTTEDVRTRHVLFSVPSIQDTTRTLDVPLASEAQPSRPTSRLPLNNSRPSLKSSTRSSNSATLSATASVAPSPSSTGTIASATETEVLDANGPLRSQKDPEGFSNPATTAIIVGILLALAACVYAIWLMIQGRARERRKSASTDPLSGWSQGSGLPMHRLNHDDGQVAIAGSDTWPPARGADDAKTPTWTSTQSSPWMPSTPGSQQSMWPRPHRDGLSSYHWSGPASSCRWREEQAWPRHTGVHGRRTHPAMEMAPF